MEKQCEEQWETMKNAEHDYVRLQDRKAGNGAACDRRSTSAAVGCGRVNVTLHLMPCAARGGDSSGIQSIPASHRCGDRGRPMRPGGVAPTLASSMPASTNA